MGLFEGSQPSEPSLVDVDNQMTLEDVYTLARTGKALTLQDFEPFFYRLTGPDYKVRRYDVAGADTVFVRVEDGNYLNSCFIGINRMPFTICLVFVSTKPKRRYISAAYGDELTVITEHLLLVL